MHDPAPDIEQTASPAATSAGPAAWQLAALSGLHAGALVDLAVDDWTLIGSAADCDIVLRDAGVMPHHAALFLRAGQPQLRAIDGSVRAQGQTVAAGQSIMLADAQTWQIGGITLGVGCRASAAWDALRRRAATDEAATAEDAADTPLPPSAFAADAPTPADDARAAAPARPPTWRRLLTRRAQQVLAGVVAGGLVLVIGAAAWSVTAHKAQARANHAVLNKLLHELQMPELHLVEVESGRWRIEGLVQTESDRARLLQGLQQVGVYPALDVVTGEQLALTVQNGFRQRGLPVQARYAGGGRVEVHGAAASPAVDQVVQDLLAATKSIKQLSLAGAAAPTAQATDDMPTPARDAAAAAPGKSSEPDPRRVIGVVGGETPFVMTQDRKRYFVGSMLPDGTQIDHIDGHTVTFSRHGKPMSVQF